MARASRRRFSLGAGALGIAGLTGLAGLACRGPRSAGTPDASAGSAKKLPKLPLPELTLVSYNVLADPVRVSERFPPLFELLARLDPDIIALQEVTDWIARLIHEQPWAQAYHASTLGGRRAHPGGQYILSKRPILRSRSLALPGRQRRTALFSTIAAREDVELTVVTTHLESFLEDGPLRARQLDAIFEALMIEDEAVLLGDFNFGDGELEEGSINAEFDDLWKQLRPQEPGFTWDIERSEMARAGSFTGEPSRRLDRVLLRSELWTGGSIEIIGDEPVHAGKLDLFPSDHFGLVATLKPAGCGECARR